MDGPPKPDGRDAAHDPAGVLSALPVGVLLVGGEEGVVRHANAGFTTVFPGLDPVGLTLGALLSLCGVRNATALVAAARAPQPGPAIRLNLPDGRPLDAWTRALPGGGAAVTLLDVSSYLADAATADSDPLTGLASRAHLLRRLTSQLAKPGRPPVALLCIELERYREMVATLGSAAGDTLLIKVGERLRNALGSAGPGGGAPNPDDLAARSGSEEFVLLQSGVPQPLAAHKLAQRVVELLGRSFVVAGDAVTMTASVGVAISPADGSNAEILLQHARLALARARGEGRGRMQFYQTEMDGQVQTRRLLELDLRRAQELGQFELAFQPQFQLAPEALIGFEALLRWRHPVRGDVAPSVFIPIAEEIGLIAQLGEWALREACRIAAGWPPPTTVSVNVSPLQLRQPGLVAAVTTALEQSGLDPRRLELEITESALLDTPDPVFAILRTLKDMGVQISMDDFGTGYSVLSNLQKFPFDKIKIDQVFVRGLEDNPESRAIVGAVTALGASLGMRTIAEGVETAQQLARIRADGCDSVQGYLTGRPMDAASVALLLGLRKQSAPSAAPS
jgi:diguanylate cyclase (GGDEF)-like protein